MFYYPLYHCARKEHYFCVSKLNFNQTIEDFVKAITIKPEYVDDVIVAMGEPWWNAKPKQVEVNQQRLEYCEGLRSQIWATVDRIRVVTSETPLKYLEGRYCRCRKN